MVLLLGEIDTHLYQWFYLFQSTGNYRSSHVVLTEEDLVSDQFRLVVVSIPHCDVHHHKRLQTYRLRQRHVKTCLWQMEELCAGNSVTGYTGEAGRFRWMCVRGGEWWWGSIPPPPVDRQKISQKKRPRCWDVLPTAILTSSHVALTRVTWCNLAVTLNTEEKQISQQRAGDTQECDRSEDDTTH